MGHPILVCALVSYARPTLSLSLTPKQVGYGSSAIVFGPQFGNFHGASAWRYSFSLMQQALRRADACVGPLVERASPPA